MRFTADRKFHFKCGVLAAIIYVIFFESIAKMGESIASLRIMSSLDSKIIFSFAFMTLCIAVVTPMTYVHEFVHALAYKAFGGKTDIVFRFSHIAIYETSGKEYTQFEFILILLSPLLLINGLCMLYPSWLTNLVIFTNTLGATADILMALIVLLNAKGKVIVDKNNGFLIKEGE